MFTCKDYISNKGQQF
ncbi:MAG TPA: hypothetical protein DEQ66_01230 [Prevotella sp.]|nr:hypothetical protein [Prevotella sp.]